MRGEDVGDGDIVQQQAHMIHSQQMKLSHLQSLLEHAMQERTGEERSELARVGQLDEVIAVREAANRTLRVENKLLQASLTKAEMECDEARSELRGKAISLESLKLSSKETQEQITLLRSQSGRLTTALEQANAWVNEARKDALDRVEEAEDARAALVVERSMHAASITRSAHREAGLLALGASRRARVVRWAAFTAWRNELRVRVQKQRVRQALEGGWRGRQLHAWRAEVAEGRMEELEKDFGTMQMRVDEKTEDAIGGVEELERELHAAEGALLICQEELDAERSDCMTLRAAADSMAESASAGEAAVRRMKEMEAELAEARRMQAIAEEELGLANDLVSTLGGAEGVERMGDTASTATAASAAGGGDLLAGGWKDTLDLIGGLLPPPLNSSRARLSARLEDSSEGQDQENPTGSEHQEEVDLKTQLKGACAELGLGSIQESLQLPALVKLCWTLQIAADQGEAEKRRSASLSQQLSDVQQQLELSEQEGELLRRMSTQVGGQQEANDAVVESLTSYVEDLEGQVAERDASLSAAFGRLKVTPVAAEGIATSSICEVVLDRQHRHTSPTTGGVWGESLDFFVQRDSDAMSIAVIEEGGSSLGKASVSIASLGLSTTDPVELWVPIPGRAQGLKVLLVIDYQGPLLALPGT